MEVEARLGRELKCQDTGIKNKASARYVGSRMSVRDLVDLLGTGEK